MKINLYRVVASFMAIALVLPVTASLSAAEKKWKALKKEEKREQIDQRADENLAALLEKSLRHFVENGWQADASANAVAWESGVNKQTSFVNGLAIYQMTDGGLMVNADIAGTKYWKDGKLNNE